MAFMTLDEAYRKAFAPAQQRMSLDEAYKKAFGGEAEEERKPQMSLDEAYAKAFGEPRQAKPTPAPAETPAQPQRLGGGSMERAIAQPEEPAEPVTLHDVADLGKRALYNFDAGMAGSIGSGIQGLSWGLNKGVTGANKAYNFIAEKAGLPQIDTSKMDPISYALYQSGQGWNDLSGRFAESGTSGEEGNLFDAVASASGSTVPFMLLGAASQSAAGAKAAGKLGAMLPATDIAAKWAKLKAYAGAAGASEALSEAGGVFDGIIGQGGTLEEADSAATKTFLLNLPINVASDALGGALGEGGGIVLKAGKRALPELAQEIMQGSISGVTGQRKKDKTPLEWADMARAVPGMIESLPEKARAEGLPAFISSALLGATEGIAGNVQESRARKEEEQIRRILDEINALNGNGAATAAPQRVDGLYGAAVEPPAQTQQPAVGQTPQTGATMPSARQETLLEALTRQQMQNPPAPQSGIPIAGQLNGSGDGKGSQPGIGKTPAPDQPKPQASEPGETRVRELEELLGTLPKGVTPALPDAIKKELAGLKAAKMPPEAGAASTREAVIRARKGEAPELKEFLDGHVAFGTVPEPRTQKPVQPRMRDYPSHSTEELQDALKRPHAPDVTERIKKEIEARRGEPENVPGVEFTGHVLPKFVTGTPAPVTAAEKPKSAGTPEARIADIVAGKLERGESLGSNVEFARIGEEAHGSTRGESGRTAKDEYDAMELGVNKYIERRGYNPSEATAEQAKADLASIERDILSKLPNTERTRSAEQEQLQQFSTPPNLSYVANWLLGAKKGDVVLEPSAGVGGLLVFPKNAGATTVANEISERRRGLLSQMGFDSVHNVDASYIDSLLPQDVRPTKVIMNPPFSSGLIAGKKRDNAVGRTHVARALGRLRDGGRAVIILGEGMGLDTAQGAKFWGEMKKKYSVRAVVGIDGSNYRKYGTSFGVVMAVVDKTGPTEGAIRQAKTNDLSQLIDKLGDIRDSSPALEATIPAEQDSGDVRQGKYGSIKDLVVATLRKANGSASGKMFVDYAKVSDEAAEKIKEATGIDVSGYTRVLTDNGIEHTLQRHGEKGKALKDYPNQVPVTPKDFELLNQVLEDPETIERGKTSRKGLERIISQKVIGDKFVIVEESRFGRDKLAFVSMRKEKASDSVAPPSTPKTSRPTRPGGDASVASIPSVGSAPVYDGGTPTRSEATRFRSEAGAEGVKSPNRAGPVTTGGSPAPSSDSAIKGGNEDAHGSSLASGKEIGKPLPRRRAEEGMTVAQKDLAEIQAERAAAASGADDDQSLFESYSPQKLKVPGAKGHPADLAQSAAMASVEPPDIKYTPKLPKKMIEEGRLSEAQVEAITYAGQAFEQTNRDGTRKGFFIGDGTGVGKGREISGIITDQIARGHGNGKAVWISEKWKLADDAKRDWQDIGNDPKDIFKQEQTLKFPDKGVLFSVYSTIRGKDGKRLKQLTDWLGEDYDGVIVLDEAHNANNIVESEGDEGGGFRKRKTASDTAKNVLALTKKYPKARVLYVSATGATEVDNLGMLDRLGLWGPGTAFGTRAAFLEQIKKGKKAAMELVARDMKALGLYISRSISFRRGKYSKEDVTYRKLEHALSKDQKTLYGEIGRAWRTVFENMEAAIDSIVGEEKNPAKRKAARNRAVNQFWSAEQASFKGVIGAMKLPGMIADMKKQLEKGNSVVVQLTQTGEAALKNAVGRMEESDTYDDIDLTPKDVLINFINNSFPVQEYHEAVIGDGEGGKPITRWEALKDGNGNFVENPEAVAIRDELISNISSIRFPDSPLDMLLNAFGADRVAEVTGRSQRLVIRDNKKTLEKIPPSARKAEVEAFQDGRKRILVFSEAGGTGASYHADARAKNQEKRVHYLLDGGWKAAAAIQGFGRTHRTNQAHAPEYVLVSTDLPGEKRFISTIAKRLEQLGALTAGERRTQTGGLFSERDNLESEYAQNAVQQLFNRIAHGRLDAGIPPQELLGAMGFGNVMSGEGGVNASNFPGVNQFLNRLLALPYETQHVVFGEFSDLIDLEIKRAVDAGEYDAGTQMIKADRVEVESEKVVHEGENGAKTSYVRLKRYTRQTPMSFAEVNRTKPRYFIVKRSGNVAAARKTKATETDSKTGLPYDRYELIGVDPAKKGTTNEKALGNEAYYEEIGASEAKALWDKQAAAFPEYREDTDHLIVGAVLPIWDRLDESKVEVSRVRTEDGRSFLGRRIDGRSIGAVLRRLGVDYDGPKLGAADVLKAIAGKRKIVELANGWTIREASVNGENRAELVGPDFTKRDYLDGLGVMSERIAWNTRWFLPASRPSALEQILKDSPVTGVRDASVREASAAALNEGMDDEAPPFGFSIRDAAASDARAASPGNPLSQADGDAPKFEGFSDRETEERYQRARKSISRGDAMTALKDSAAEFVKGFASDFPKIMGQRFDAARESLRKMNRRRGVAITEALDSLRASVRGLSPDQYDLFSRKAILDDLTYQKQEMPDSGLPFGLTDESLKREHGRVTAAAEKDPAVMKALDMERGSVARVNRELIAAADAIGWHSMSEKFKNPHYFRHVVLKYAEAGAQGRKPGLKAPENRGYYKRRRGSEEDFLSNYVQAMGEVRALQMQDIETMKALKAIKDGYDVSERLKRLAFAENEGNFLAHVAAAGKEFLGMDADEAAAFAQKQMGLLNRNQAMAMSRLFRLASDGALPEGKFASLVQDMADAGSFEGLEPGHKKQFGRYLSWLASLKDDAGTMEARTYFKYTAAKKKTIEATLGKENVTWRDMMPEGYAEWHPFQNRMVFSVSTVAENIVERALEQGLGELSIPMDELRKMNVLGGHRQSWAIPQGLAETLDKMGKPVERGMLGKAAKAVTSAWKQFVLLSPMRVFKYNARNISGDADTVMGASPDAFRHVPRAFNDLYQAYKAGKAPEGELAEFAARGGSVGSLHLAELGDETFVKEFQAILDKGEAGLAAMPRKLWHKYWNGARMSTDMRENLLRYAAYLSYLEQMQKSGTGKPRNFGASKRSEVMAIQDIRDRAFKLSNELLGAYDQVSETGRYLRDIAIPFYSWMEVNARRYYQIFRNGMEDGDIGQAAKRTLMGQAMKSPVYAWRFAKTAFKVSLFSALVAAYNRLRFPDEEDDLPPDVRNRPHLILGRDADGKVRYFDRLGALADLLDWFALDTMHSDIKDILDGHQSLGDYAKKMAMAPVSKLFNAINPIPKAAVEVVSRKQYYPDVSNPRAIRDMGVYLANAIGLAPEFVALTGRPSKGYLHDRLGNMFSYSLDPDEAAYWLIQDKKRQFQENVLGTGWSGGHSASARGQALWNIKRGIRFGDRKAVARYAKEYLAYGGTDKGLESSIGSMSPHAGLSGENQELFYKWLSAEDRKYLKKAYRHYDGLLSSFGLK